MDVVARDDRRCGVVRMSFVITVVALLALVSNPLVVLSVQFETPLIIAHRGASGYQPEESVGSYDLAALLSADFLETDLCATKDGYLICHHDCELSSTTNVQNKTEFSNRYSLHREGFPDGGYFTENFTLSEIKQLKVKQPNKLRNHAFDYWYEIMTVDEFLVNAKMLSERSASKKTYGVYIEMKTPGYFASIGLPLEQRLLNALLKSDLYGSSNRDCWSSATSACPVFIQSFESTSLVNFDSLQSKVKTSNGSLEYPLIQLLETAKKLQADTKKPYSEMMTAKGLAKIAKYAYGIGPNWLSLVKFSETTNSYVSNGVIEAAHDNGISVHPYTLREDTSNESIDLDTVRAKVREQMVTLFALGVDGIFTDEPDIGIEARKLFKASIIEDKDKEDSSGWAGPLIYFCSGVLFVLGVLSIAIYFGRRTVSSEVINSDPESVGIELQSKTFQTALPLEDGSSNIEEHTLLAMEDEEQV